MPEPKPKYGRPHRRVKEQFRPAVERGTVRCWRCAQFIVPGQRWDLGHVDGDPSRYAGPEHSSCNRRTVSHLKQRLAAASGEAAPVGDAPALRPDHWRTSYPAEWPPDPEPTNAVSTWSRHWSCVEFNPRCPDCRAAGGPCEDAVAWRDREGA
jgi:hypothetical protein